MLVAVVISVVEVIETTVGLLGPVSVPLAPVKRPVPPVIVVTPVVSMGGPNVPDPMEVVNSSSPLAETRVSVPVKLNPLVPVRVNVRLPLPVNLPKWERCPVRTIVAAPVRRLTVVTFVVLPFSGLVTRFAVAIAAVGATAAIPRAKLETTMSLRSGIGATPFLGHALFSRSEQARVPVDGRSEAERDGGSSVGSSGKDSTRSKLHLTPLRAGESSFRPPDAIYSTPETETRPHRFLRSSIGLIAALSTRRAAVILQARGVSGSNEVRPTRPRSGFRPVASA